MTPGIKHLCKIMKEASKRLPITDAYGDGSNYGLDISIVIMKALRNVDASDQFWQDPMVPVTAITIHLDKLKNTMDGANISFIAVFDGCRHPLKGKTTEKRNNIYETKSQQLKELVEANDPNNYPIIRKLRRDTVKMRPDIIAVAREWCDTHGVKYICAPFEADWQLAMMCKQGFIQGVISEDSDMIVLGISKVVMGLNLVDKTFILVEYDHVIEVLKDRLSVVDFSHDHLLAYAAFLGNDYLDNVKGNGLKEIENYVMPMWCTLTGDEEDKLLKEYETSKQWNKSSGGGLCDDYAITFRRCTNMWKYAVGWRIVPDAFSGALDIDTLLLTKSYTVIMDSINPCADRLREGLVGFNAMEVFQEVNNVVDVTLMDYCTLKYYSRCGELVEPIPVSLVPHGAYFTSTTPLNCQPMSALVQWLCARRIPVRQHDTRGDLLALVEKILTFQERVGNDNIPPVIPLPVGGVGKYVSWETLTSNTVVDWKSGDELFRTIQDLFPLVNDQMIDETFGKDQQPALRLKSKRYVRSGHYDFTTMRQGDAIVNYGDDVGLDIPVRILKIDCCASLRSDVYQVLLVFNAETQAFLSFPISRCQCKNGRVFCSHMLGMLFVVSIMQRLRMEKPFIMFDGFVETMPAVISSLRGLIVPLSYAITSK